MLRFGILPWLPLLAFALFCSGLNASFSSTYGQFFVEPDTNSDTNVTSGLSSPETDEDSSSAEIVLLSQKLKKSSFGYRHLVGQVKNIGTDTAQFVKIVINTYDKNGDLIGTDFTFATSTTLKSNQKSSFDLASDTQNFKGSEYYEISLQWNNPDFTEEYVENAQIYKDNSTKTSE